MGCLHRNIFTRKVTDIAFACDFCNNHSHPVSPVSLYLTSLRPRPTRPRVPYLMSSSPSSRVPTSQVPSHASRCPRPLVPVPLLYTARAKAATRKAVLEAEAVTLKMLHEIEEEELKLRQRKNELKLKTELAKARAEEHAYERVEIGANSPHASDQKRKLPPTPQLTEDKTLRS